jgi:lauroyl/myristoyl acyltransferase
VPVIVVGCFKEDGDTYRLLAAPPMVCRFDRKRSRDEQIQEWAQAYADQVGAWVQRWPHQWYNFHDLWSQEAGPAVPSRSQSGLAEEPIVT